MLGARSGLQEKLTLFWHDHFATGIAKVRDAKFMGVQNALFRTMGKGSFRDLVNAVHRDPAMVDWLDTDTSRKQQPNENYGRELMELFTLGVFDFAGKANHDQQDVSQIARAFTGWNRVVYFQGDRMLRGGTLFTPGLHDYYYAADGSVEDAYGRDRRSSSRRRSTSRPRPETCPPRSGTTPRIAAPRETPRSTR